MIFIHDISAISPQLSFCRIDLDEFQEYPDNKLYAREPAYEGIPPGLLRRMGKAVRIGVGASLPLIRKNPPVAGIIIGTANGGQEDCIKFLNQIVEYEEGLLAPGNFVQSTANAVAAQIGLMTTNKGYNITHVHRGHAFENALLDAAMLIRDNPDHHYLLGAVDEISSYNYNIDRLAGWFREVPVSNRDIYQYPAEGSLAGEGAAAFRVNGIGEGALACISGLKMFHADNPGNIAAAVDTFRRQFMAGLEPELLISGENGDSRFDPAYELFETAFSAQLPVCRFKHLCGEYPTASSFAVWLACRILQTGQVPGHLFKRGSISRPPKSILICNGHKGTQFSLILVRTSC